MILYADRSVDLSVGGKDFDKQKLDTTRISSVKVYIWRHGAPSYTVSNQTMTWNATRERWVYVFTAAAPAGEWEAEFLATGPDGSTSSAFATFRTIPRDVPA